MSWRGYSVPLNSLNTKIEPDDNTVSVAQTEKFLKNPTNKLYLNI